MTCPIAATLSEGLKAYFEESDGITVWIPSELAQAIYTYLSSEKESIILFDNPSYAAWLKTKGGGM